MERVSRRHRRPVPKWIQRLLPQNGLTRRWFQHAFLLIAAFLLVLQVLFSVMLFYFYYDSVHNALHSRAQLYRRTLELSGQTETVPWETRSRELIAYFTDKDKMELQVLSSTGQILLSSTGFAPLKEPAVPDFQQALTVPDGTGLWRGHNSAGEPVMALTMLETDSKGAPVGALRYVVSLSPVNRQIWLLILLLFVFFAADYFLCVPVGYVLYQFHCHPGAGYRPHRPAHRHGGV